MAQTDVFVIKNLISCQTEEDLKSSLAISAPSLSSIQQRLASPLQKIDWTRSRTATYTYQPCGTSAVVLASPCDSNLYERTRRMRPPSPTSRPFRNSSRTRKERVLWCRDVGRHRHHPMSITGCGIASFGQVGCGAFHTVAHSHRRSAKGGPVWVCYLAERVNAVDGRPSGWFDF